jgi:hypothetical protein
VTGGRGKAGLEQLGPIHENRAYCGHVLGPPALALQPLDRREDAPPFSLALIEPGKLGIDRTVPVVHPGRRFTGLESGLGPLVIVVAGGKQKVVMIGIEEFKEATGDLAVDGELLFAHWILGAVHRCPAVERWARVVSAGVRGRGSLNCRKIPTQSDLQEMLGFIRYLVDRKSSRNDGR